MRKYIGLMLIPFLLSGCIQYSNGTRTGIVTKFSERGLIWKKWEGQMVLGGIVDGAANTWDFSVDNLSQHGENKSEIVKKLQQAQDDGKRIKIHYRREMICAPWRSETSYLVVGVEEPKKV